MLGVEIASALPLGRIIQKAGRHRIPLVEQTLCNGDPFESCQTWRVRSHSLPTHSHKRSHKPTKIASEGRAILAMIVAVMITVSVAVPVPVVVMVKAAMIAFPVTLKELLSVVVRPHPSSTLIWWSRPVTFMPFVVPSDRIPITVYPHRLWAWTWRQNTNHMGARRGADSDSQGNLSMRCRYSGQQHGGQQRYCSNEILDDV